MKNRIFTLKFALTMIGAGLFATSCNKENATEIPIDPNADVTFHLAYGVGYRGTASAYVAPLTDLKTGTITFEGQGKVGKSFESARTHRFYASSDGKYFYDLEYGNGKIVKYALSGNSELYNVEKSLSVTNIIGTTHPRWRVIDDNNALLFNIVPKHQKNTNTGAITSRNASTLRIIHINLSNFTLGTPVDVELPAAISSNKLPDAHIWRVDNAIVHKGKVYIGTAVQGFDGKDVVATRQYGTGQSLISHPATTLVLDYPSFQNPKITTSTLGNGETYGYRAPAYFVDEAGDVYNISMEESRILKINPQTGEYDNTYDFDLASKLGIAQVGGTGIFYAGNGIAYVPFYDVSKGRQPAEAAWGLARVDLKAKTLIKMNLPEKLWLNYYQSAKLGKDGKLYMAITPTDNDGNIYIFDPTNASPTGYTKGATLKVSGEGFYMGVF